MASRRPALVGMVWLGDAAGFVRIASIMLIIGGIVGLDVAGSNAH